MNKDFYISLISKKLSNELNAAELKDLNTWLSSDKANSSTLNQFKSTWDLTQNYKQEVSFDADAAFMSFTEKFDIPKPKTVAAVEPKSKTGVKSGILLIVIFLLLTALVGSLVYNNFYNPRKTNNVANSEMHAQTFDVNEMAKITLAPNSAYTKGSYSIVSKTNNDKKNKGQSINDRSSNNNTNSNVSNGNALGSSNSGSDSSNIGSALSNGTNNGMNSSSPKFESINIKSNNLEMAVENFTGQGYFDINAKPGAEPMRVGLDGNVYVESENAAYNLQNYKDDEFSILDVQTGSVKFVAGDNILNVTEGQRLIYNEQTGNYKTVALPALSPFKWHKGILVFDETPIEEVFTKIERFFGVNISYVSTGDLSETSFTATLYKSSTLSDCLEMLSGSIEMEIVRNGQRDIQINNIKPQKG